MPKFNSGVYLFVSVDVTACEAATWCFEVHLQSVVSFLMRGFLKIPTVRCARFARDHNPQSAVVIFFV